jgi:hypothetical protein
MPSFSRCIKGALACGALLLSACATSGVSVSDLYQSNYGREMLPHLDASYNPDPMAIANGMYAPRAVQECYLCSSQSRLGWATWAP